MKKYMLCTVLFVSLSASAMTQECKDVAKIFEGTGALITASTSAAKGQGATKLSEGKTTLKEYQKFETQFFTPRMTTLLKSIEANTSHDNRTPLFFGNIAIQETSNYNETIKGYLSNRNPNEITALREIMGRIGNAYKGFNTLCKE